MHDFVPVWASCLLLLASACVENQQRSPPIKPDRTGPTTTGTGVTTTTPSSTTTTTPTDFDCTALPEGPFDIVPFDVQTEEDFDFDGDGFVVYQQNSTLVGVDQYGNERVYAAGVSGDPAGVQVLYSTDIVVAAQDSGTLERVNVQTGNTTTIISGLVQANGIEVGSGDRLYFTEFTTNGSVRWFDPTSGTGEIISDATSPNGLALSPDEQVLYVAGGAFGGNSSILAFDRISDDKWEDAPRVIYDGNDEFDGVEVDMCGNIYTIEFSSGHLYRITPDGSDATLLAVVDDPQAGWTAWNSIRWGNDIGGWSSTSLYLTNRSNLWEVNLGVPGRQHPTMGP